jgi:hypothetical protein
MSFDPTTAKQIPNFDGADYQPERDNPRLRGQLLRVWNEVKAGDWKTLRSIADRTGDPEASVSAQLRHLRKDRFGAHEVERRHKGNGVYEYRLLINKTPLD